MVTKRERLHRLLDDQRKWVKEHGDTRAGYRERYGVKGETMQIGNTIIGWHGDGGDAIYDADMNELRKLEDQVRALRPVRN